MHKHSIFFFLFIRHVHTVDFESKANSGLGQIFAFHYCAPSLNVNLAELVKAVPELPVHPTIGIHYRVWHQKLQCLHCDGK